MTHPTGTQLDITLGDQSATVTGLGAGLRRYAVEGRDVVKGFGADEPVSGGRGQQLVPWPNRIRDGRYPWGGTTQQLWLTEPARHNASHGLARYVPWTVTEHGDSHVVCTLTIYPQPGWPGILHVRLRYALTDDGLHVTVEARNDGDADVPFGYGAHPYLTVGESSVDEVEVTLPAASRLEVDDRLLPVAVSPVEGTGLDLRERSRVGDRVLDTAYTDLAREADGGWTATLSREDRTAELWADSSFGWAQVFTGEKRRDVGLAVEPMTCGPDAFNPGPTHDGMRTLAPGQSLRLRWGIRGS
ncbi:aldose 1-epimerase family protein [Microlunatus flavus]|uniref:Aldose 1-epimerase n=1 Tax=Microlunatus flavus TaxID=1036181 RepID=A0A1H9JC49_9ACTN|nr:aldose 1-epimerase family protein [Microlunatus flavus]SEQ84309.1 aldose 1-epimerase [Microlunatus flavus]